MKWNNIQHSVPKMEEKDVHSSKNEKKNGKQKKQSSLEKRGNDAEKISKVVY